MPAQKEKSARDGIEKAPPVRTVEIRAQFSPEHPRKIGEGNQKLVEIQLGWMMDGNVPDVASEILLPGEEEERQKDEA